MDQIEQRLRETSENCFKCYEAWMGNKKSPDIRASLQDSIHELRRVASRLEIEIAVSERDSQSQKPLAPPQNRNAGRQQTAEGGERKPKVELKPRKKISKKPADGGEE